MTSARSTFGENGALDIEERVGQDKNTQIWKTQDSDIDSRPVHYVANVCPGLLNFYFKG